MSNSIRARERRSRRSRWTSHQRDIKAQQGWGESQSKTRKGQPENYTKLASILRLLKK